MWGLHELAQCTWCRLGEAEDSTPHGVSRITGVELHQNPSYECIIRGPAKWALATLELIHAMRVVIVEDELG